MKVTRNILILVAMTTVSSAALADDPNDAKMRDAEARAQDREMVRQLNRQQNEEVRERDARYAEGWRNWREAQSPNDYASRKAEFDRANSEYAERRAAYEREMGEWRRNVEACRKGDFSACEG